jgi:hypothetical protein
VSHEDERARLLARIRATPSPTRAQHQVRSLIAVGVAAAVMIALLLAFGGVRPGGMQASGVPVARPLELMFITFAGAALIAGAGWWALVARGRSMLGRRTAWLALAGAAVVLLLFGWKVAASSIFTGMTLPWPGRPGLRCLGLSLLLGAWLLGALIVARRNSDATHPRVTGAALGVAAGACTWVLMDLWCPVAHPQHLLLGHVLPIGTMALAGAWLGHRWVGLKIS